MQLAKFDYYLPKELIAQYPAEPRDSSRLIVLNGERIEHRNFRDLTDILEKGDTIVLNDSKVIPAKLRGKKETGGKVEVLLISKIHDGTWNCLIKGKKIRNRMNLIFGEGLLKGRVQVRSPSLGWAIAFENEENLPLLIEMPIPPYIKTRLKKPDRYQTVYAKFNGSLAAPTAGLHFTENLLKHLTQKGINLSWITLHTGISTFLPVKTEQVESHKMDKEFYRIDEGNARIINETLAEKRRLIAVGTTSVRALESTADANGKISFGEGWTDLFIYPRYKFKVPFSGLITNFHLPKSTLFMLVCAYAGRENILRAYKTAIDYAYRFYSFGDAMLILGGDKKNV